MMTERAEKKLAREKEPKMSKEALAAVAPDLATLMYRTSDAAVSENILQHLGKFDNPYIKFGNLSERDRRLYIARFQKHLDLKAALKGITRDGLVEEAEAEAVLDAMSTMGLEGFTTREMTTQRVYESAGRPREAPGFFSRLMHRERKATEAPPPEVQP